MPACPPHPLSHFSQAHARLRAGWGVAADSRVRRGRICPGRIIRQTERHAAFCAAVVPSAGASAPAMRRLQRGAAKSIIASRPGLPWRQPRAAMFDKAAMLDKLHDETAPGALRPALDFQAHLAALEARGLLVRI